MSMSGIHCKGLSTALEENFMWMFVYSLDLPNDNRIQYRCCDWCQNNSECYNFFVLVKKSFCEDIPKHFSCIFG